MNVGGEVCPRIFHALRMEARRRGALFEMKRSAEQTRSCVLTEASFGKVLHVFPLLGVLNLACCGGCGTRVSG